MADIKYSIGGTAFDAVPEELSAGHELPVRSQATIGRAIVHTVGVARETFVLSGKFMTTSVRSAIRTMHESCEATGQTVVFNDGYTNWNVLIRSFRTTPIIGVTEGYSFRLELEAVSEG